MARPATYRSVRPSVSPPILADGLAVAPRALLLLLLLLLTTTIGGCGCGISA